MKKKGKQKKEYLFFKWVSLCKYTLSCKKNALHSMNVALYFLLTHQFFTHIIPETYKKIKQTIRLLRYRYKILRDRPLLWQYAFSKTTFLLCIRPKSRFFNFPFFKKKYHRAKYFPPPGYGVPPGYESFVEEHNYRPNKEYALYLFPGRINFAFGFLTLLLSLLIFTPFMYESGPGYEIMIVIYWLVGYWLYAFLFKKMIPVSLANVWEKWPIPAYELFLSVPHTIHISHCDRLTKIKPSSDNKDNPLNPLNPLSYYQKPQEHVFWNPDIKTPMWRQSTENAPYMHTLQELVLNLAVFEFLFHKNDPQDKRNNGDEKDATLPKKPFEKIIPKSDSIREYHWYFFLFAPIFVNLILILLAIFLFAVLKGYVLTECTPSSDSPEGFRAILYFPYNIMIAVLSWFLFTLFYVSWILETLTDLSKKIRQDYFNTQLDLIPQQILNELSYIPTQQQIDSGIAYVKRILHWSSGIVFIGLVALLEVFSQSASREYVDYQLWESFIKFFGINH